ncbi:MAG: hypothetical protein KDB27_20710 [Planctomycetales bacterium]|nr:hypothetical protein [Planctomycetales bacterium]
MVLVPESPPSANPAADLTPQLSDGLSGSFDNIDSVLDGVAEPEVSYVVDRWKTLGKNPSEDLATISSADVVPEEADVTESTVSEVEASQAASSVLLVKKVLLVAGAVAFGTIAAVGVITVMANKNTEVSSTQSELLGDDAVAAVDPVDHPGQNGTGDASNDTGESDDTDQPIEASVTDVAAADAGLQIDNASSDDEPANDFAVEDSNSVPAEPADTLTNDAPADPSPANSNESEAVDNSGVQLVTESPLGQNDELASFVDWLKQEPVAPVTDVKASAIQDSDPIPENAVQPLVVTNRPTPPVVDVEARLKDPVEGIKFDDTPLIDALRAIQYVSTIPVSVEPDALYLARTSAREKISLQQGKQSVGKLLSGVLSSVSKGKLATEIDGGHLLVTTRGLTNFRTVPHKVGDLASNPTEAAELAVWISALIAPGTWSDDGGRGTAEAKSASIEVTHNSITHYRVYRFLARLRAARGVDAKKLAGEHGSLVPRPKRDEKLQTTVTAKFVTETDLTQIVSSLEGQSDVSILIDWRSLHAAGWSPKDRLTFYCDNVPLKGALDQLLTPMGLAVNVVDDSTVQVVYPVTDPSWDVEFYKLPKSQTEASAAETVKQIALATGVPATSVWDQKSKRLIVAAPQSIQRRVIAAFEE